MSPRGRLSRAISPSPWRAFAVLAVFYALALGGRSLWSHRVRELKLAPLKPVYLHHEMVELELRAGDPELRSRWLAQPPRAAVTRGGKRVTTIAGLVETPLTWSAGRGAFLGRWPVPWNAETGEYGLELAGGGDLGERKLQLSGFRIERRAPHPIPQGFSVVTLETSKPLAEMKVRGPDGKETDWRGMLDWVQYVGADAFWMMGGQTPGLEPGEKWVKTNMALIPEVARECHKRGIKFGVYAMCFLTMSHQPLPGYEYALDVQDGHTIPTRAISIRDERRIADIAALLREWSRIPEVDYVGLDYIRNALGGYELAEDFYEEMPGVHPPPNWAKLSTEDRRVFFARKKIMRRDLDFIDAWQWWRAHRVGGIVERIKREVGGDKPLWAFTLTWEKGWHHGQDPVMMNDAGVDVDALMFYEATREQFDAMLGAWRRYVRRGDVQLVVGDVVDWPLHQKDPAGPKELYRRAASAIDGVYADGPARGVFFHDLNRALFGRLGAWGTRGWMDEIKRAITHMRQAAGKSA